jgi:predicted esterase
MELSLVTIPPTKPHTHTVVFLHGGGDTAKNFSACLVHSRGSRNRNLPEHFPSFRWVFPQSELRESAAFPRSGKSSQWFDIWDRTDFSVYEEVQAPGLRESVTSIWRFLRSEAAALDGRWERLVLAGISQGAATSVHTLLNLSLPPTQRAIDQQYSPRLGAFLGFSCRMPFPGRTLLETRQVLDWDGAVESNDLLRNTPVLLEHCVDDPTVLVESGRGLRDTLQGFGSQVTWKEYPDGGHWFNSPAGIDDVVEFLSTHVLEPSSIGDTLSRQVDAMDLS